MNIGQPNLPPLRRIDMICKHCLKFPSGIVHVCKCVTGSIWCYPCTARCNLRKETCRECNAVLRRADEAIETAMDLFEIPCENSGCAMSVPRAQQFHHKSICLNSVSYPVCERLILGDACREEFFLRNMEKDQRFLNHIRAHYPVNSLGEVEVITTSVNARIPVTLSHQWNSTLGNFNDESHIVHCYRTEESRATGMGKIEYLVLTRHDETTKSKIWEIFSLDMASETFVRANIRISSFSPGLAEYSVPDEIISVKGFGKLKEFLVTPDEEWKFSLMIPNEDIVAKFVNGEGSVSIELKFID